MNEIASRTPPQHEPFTAPAHAVEVAEILARFSVAPDHGLTEGDVQQRRQQFGSNELLESPPPPWWRRLLAQFGDLVIWILIVAAAISGMLGEWVDALAILAIVLLNGIIGFFQEERAEQALAALRKMAAPLAKVLRSGRPVSIPAGELVPGDVVEVLAGDHVPADARLVESFSLLVQEASLTGESVPVEKDTAVMLAEDTPLGDRRNMLYMGTVAASGKGRGIVVATGMQTELGRIAGMLERREPEPTPLQRRLAELGRLLIVVCFVIVGVIFGLQLFRGGELVEAFLVSVSLAVAAVPEGLPAVVTIALALGLQRMVKRRALVRKLPSVETLGSVTVICTDKTGTLTRNEMTVQEILAGGEHFGVTGVGYVPQGEFYRLPAVGQAGRLEPDRERVVINERSGLWQALVIGAACNDARLVPGQGEDPNWQVIGDPTEGALLVAAMKAGIDPAAERRHVTYQIPFDSTRKMMSVVVQRPDGNRRVCCKGAPESVLHKCLAEWTEHGSIPLTSPRREELLRVNASMAHRSLRVLALAQRDELPADAAAPEQLETSLTFVGLVGMIDPPREEAKQAVATCREAGIRPVMVTGDHPETAMAIAQRLGMVNAGDRALPGAELDRLADAELRAEIGHVVVFARATAAHKLRIVRAWKSRGEVVAMTGDGVNDAPAVREADIGIAMGVTGTDVTKEASDMILTDDNFASIVSAIEEGRGIFDNIQKVLQFLLSCNFSEILLMLVASLLGWPLPLLPIQLLWINLVTDGMPALALSVEPPEEGLMRRPPRPPQEPILSKRIGLNILLTGVILAAVSLIAFGTALEQTGHDAERARSITFLVVVYSQLFRALAARSQTWTFWRLGPFTNPYLLLAVVVSGLLQVSIAVVPFTQRVFDVPDYTTSEWWLILILALTPVTIIELAKFVIFKPGPASP